MNRIKPYLAYVFLMLCLLIFWNNVYIKQIANEKINSLVQKGIC